MWGITALILVILFVLHSTILYDWFPNKYWLYLGGYLIGFPMLIALLEFGNLNKSLGG